ncbi:hypothetical protein RRG08_007920 [Elysia crispata]|uniref:Uncharacterized protein n=1 Tax=Elysia crispata TaxID=231223 RepID=A0AAE1DJY9_9GAST|nr:hypothetical protein RRG08_007920 [Elysia crispata]
MLSGSKLGLAAMLSGSKLVLAAMSIRNAKEPFKLGDNPEEEIGMKTEQLSFCEVKKYVAIVFWLEQALHTSLYLPHVVLEYLVLDYYRQGEIMPVCLSAPLFLWYSHGSPSTRFYITKSIFNDLDSQFLITMLSESQNIFPLFCPLVNRRVYPKLKSQATDTMTPFQSGQSVIINIEQYISKLDSTDMGGQEIPPRVTGQITEWLV